MKYTFIEVTNGLQNWGKFMVAKWDESDWERPSAVGSQVVSGLGAGLLHLIGENRRCVWVIDLQTGEGARFLPGGYAGADLTKHKIWVCPMFEPFLEWFYAHPEHHEDPTTLPAHVDLEDAPFEMSGHRRPGAESIRERLKEVLYNVSALSLDVEKSARLPADERAGGVLRNLNESIWRIGRAIEVLDSEMVEVRGNDSEALKPVRQK